jgi:hypothetical protein
MSKQNFVSHGNIEISVDNDLITLDVEGPCNTEFFQNMSKKLALIGSQINVNNYTVLVIFRKEALATPEAMTYFTNYLKKVNVRAVATNLQYAYSPTLTEEMCKKSYHEAGVKHQFFVDNETAYIWLRKCMLESK